MIFDDYVMSQCKSLPCAFANVFGREEQREGLLQGFGVHAVTCIADRDHDILTRQNF